MTPEIDADWIDAPRDVTARINAAVREVEVALDLVPHKPTWGHLVRQLRATQRAAERAVQVAVEARQECIYPPGQPTQPADGAP